MEDSLFLRLFATIELDVFFLRFRLLLIFKSYRLFSCKTRLFTLVVLFMEESCLLCRPDETLSLFLSEKRVYSGTESRR